MSELQYPVGMATFSELIEDADIHRVAHGTEASSLRPARPSTKLAN